MAYYSQKKYSRKGKHTRKKGGSKYKASFEKEVVLRFIQMLNTIKLYHWRTSSFATHKATDEAYASLNTNVDKFVEVMLGKGPNRVTLHMKSIPLHECVKESEFKREVEKFKSFLVELESMKGIRGMSNSDLINIRDEILADMNQLLYLLTFK